MKLAAFILAFCTLGPVFALAQEPVLERGQSFQLRIAGIPPEEATSISQFYTISDGGTIKLLYLNEMTAAGLRPSELARKVESSYRSAEIYTKPNVTISITESGAVQRYVSVLGEVNQRRQVLYTPGLTMIDAIAQCGGFSDFGDPKRVKLTRKGKASYHDLSRTTSGDNQTLQPNDIVSVPARRGPLGNLLGGRKD